MIRHLSFLGIITSTILIMAVLGCSDKKSTNSFDDFNPEIINNPDAFEFQITDAENVTTTVEYNWENSGTAASIDQSCAITQGNRYNHFA